MAKLYATISYDHHGRYISRLGHKRISTTAETWTGKIKVDLDKDGKCHIRITDKHNNHITTVLEANLDDIVKSKQKQSEIQMVQSWARQSNIQ